MSMGEPMNDGVVRITLQQVYGEVTSMKNDLSDVKGLLEKHLALQEQANLSIETRLENHGTRLGNHDTDITGLSNRMLTAESDIKLLKDVNATREQRRTPWWSWIAGIGGSIAGLSGLTGLWLLLDKIAAAYGQTTP